MIGKTSKVQFGEFCLFCQIQIKLYFYAPPSRPIGNHTCLDWILLSPHPQQSFSTYSYPCHSFCSPASSTPIEANRQPHLFGWDTTNTSPSTVLLHLLLPLPLLLLSCLQHPILSLLVFCKMPCTHHYYLSYASS